MGAALARQAQAATAPPQPVLATVSRAPRVQRRAVAPAWRLPVQMQLRVSQRHDPAELEADTTARAVMRLQGPAVSAAAAVPTVQRKSSGDSADTQVEAEIRGAQGGGMPLPAPLRRFMEPRFRADFSAVRVHTDGRAAGLAARLAARAFAFGRHIFFGRSEFQPETPAGQELIAHELTHTIQQRAAVQRQAAGPDVQQREAPSIQRLGLDTVLDYIADKANLIPGFRMFTIVLGVNPVNMSRVEATPANLLRAAIEFIPGAALVTQALDQHGVFDKVAHWAAQQIKALGLVGAAIKKALMAFLDSLGFTDLARPGATFDRAKRIFTEPIDRIKNLVKGFASAIVGFVKEAILKPIARLAEGTPSYDLLKGVMGEDPITGEKAADSADLLIGGFMKLIGQGEVYDNAKKSGAVPKAWAWFKGALADLKAFVREIPPRFVAAFKSLELADIVLVPRAFAKLAGVFGGFLARFISWAGQAVWNLLEIIFSVVKPGALDYVKKTGAALKGILKNPLPFVGNLARAAKAGFQNFATRFGSHLQKGLIEWLTGALVGVYIPKALSLPEVVKFALSVLGLTWANLRAKMVKAFGEPAVAALEKGFAIVKTLVTEGPAAAWEQMKAELLAQKDVVVDGIKNMVTEVVVTKAIPKLVAMFIPGAGFISAIVSIYDLVMVFVQKLATIKEVVVTFVDSIVAIAAGAIDAAANKVESVLAGLLSLAINFLAGFAGLGKIAAKINGIIEKIRAPVDKALESLVGWIKKAAAKLLDGVMAGAAKLVDWWKEKEPFKNSAGESHTLQFIGSGESAKLGIRSELQSVEAYLVAYEANLAPNDTKGRDNLKTARTVFERSKRVIFTPLAKGAAEKERRQKVKTELAKISAAFAKLAGEPPKAGDYPKSTEPDYAKLEVMYIVGDAKPGSAPPKRPGDGPEGWKEIVDAGLTTISDKWVQMHIISEQLGGKGVKANLIPAPNSVNTGPFRSFEQSTKALAKARSGNVKNVVWVKVEVTRAGTYATRIRGQSGLWFWMGLGATNKWVKNTSYSFFSQAAIPAPPFGADQYYSLNFSSGTDLGKIVKDTKLVQLIKQGRMYPSIPVFISRIEERAAEAGVPNYKGKIQALLAKKVVLNEAPNQS